MFISWRGLGYLVLFFGFGFAMVTYGIVDRLLGANYHDGHDWPTGVSLFFSETVCWYLGLHLHNKNARVVVDQMTGQEIILVKSHDFIGIPMHFWGVIFLAAGVFFCVKEFFQSSP